MLLVGAADKNRHSKEYHACPTSDSARGGASYSSSEGTHASSSTSALPRNACRATVVPIRLRAHAACPRTSGSASESDSASTGTASGEPQLLSATPTRIDQAGNARVDEHQRLDLLARGLQLPRHLERDHAAHGPPAQPVGPGRLLPVDRRWCMEKQST